MARRLHTNLRQRRLDAGLEQRDLARRIGVSRQTISAVETGATVPSTEIALDLARALGCKVEDLFSTDGADQMVNATLVDPRPVAVRARRRLQTRVALGLVRERWVAHPIEACGTRAAATAADGVAGDSGAGQGARVRVRPFRDSAQLRTNLLVAGCDPAIGLLAGHLEDSPLRAHMRWLPLGSGAALDALANHYVHVAGIHYSAGDGDDANTRETKQRLPGRSFTVVNLACWDLGLVSRPGGRRRFSRIAHLLGPDVRVVAREAGSGAQRLLERHLRAAGAQECDLTVVSTASGHLEVAQAVAFGLADVGVANREAADAFGLAFEPLEQARFDLVVPAESLEHPGTKGLLDTLGSARLRRELHSLDGYDTRRTGEVLARLGP